MKLSIAVSAFALAVSAGAALAAPSLSRQAQPPAFLPPPPPPMWTGFYAGLNAGYGWGATTSVGTSAIEANPLSLGGFQNGFHDPAYMVGAGGLAIANSGAAAIDRNGFFGGGQVGYNYQAGPNLVFGLEVDMQGASVRGSGGFSAAGLNRFISPLDHGPVFLDQATAGGANVEAGLDWMGTVRGRIGYLVTPTLMVFATGGLSYGGAWANVNYNSATVYGADDNRATTDDRIPTQMLAGSARASQTLVGWNAGGGLEWMIMPNWSLKAEAFYYDLGSMNVSGGGVSTNIPEWLAMGHHHILIGSYAINSTTRVRYDGVIARAGVNYHFNWGSTPSVLQ